MGDRRPTVCGDECLVTEERRVGKTVARRRVTLRCDLAPGHTGWHAGENCWLGWRCQWRDAVDHADILAAQGR